MFCKPEHIFWTCNWPLTYLVEITCLHLSHITTLFIPSVGWELQAKKKESTLSALYHHKTQVFRPYEWLSARSLYHRTQVVDSYECLPCPYHVCIPFIEFNFFENKEECKL